MGETPTNTLYYIYETLPSCQPIHSSAAHAAESNVKKLQTTISVMKITKQLLLATLLLAASAVKSNAWHKLGTVYCDANTNGIIDTGDTPVQGVLVVVTNLSGSFSNASWTLSDGSFVIDLQDEPDLYVDYIHPSTLPANTLAVLPAFDAFATTPDQSIITNNFLIENPGCVGVTPPSTNTGCWLTGGGTIKGGKGQPIHSFGGVVNPGCSPTAAGGGNWNDIAHAAKLHFRGLTMQVVDCGNVPGLPPGSRSPKTPFNFIEFQGTGTLKGIAGNRADYGAVNFFAHAEDIGEPGHRVDRLYLRVYDGLGNTLLLISADAANPLNIAPVAISTGNLQMHSCKAPK